MDIAMKNENMRMLEAALASPRCIISVMGAHAGEGVDEIFDRKIADIKTTGITFWLMRSPKARPAKVQEICQTKPVYTIFIEPATSAGARPTTAANAAKKYSADGKSWYQFPEYMGPVTGKLDNSAYALVFGMLTTDVSGTLDLWNYADFSDAQRPLKFILGCSTMCAVQQDMKSHPDRMKSRYRKVIALAQLAKPFCVWLR